jgi:hypothetical protein
MNLDERDGHTEQGITQRNAGVGVGAGVDENEGNALVAGGVDAIDKRVFGIALEYRQRMAQAFRKL